MTDICICLLFILVALVSVFVVLCEIASQLKTIAERIYTHTSGYANGYDAGYKKGLSDRGGIYD